MPFWVDEPATWSAYTLARPKASALGCSQLKFTINPLPSGAIRAILKESKENPMTAFFRHYEEFTLSELIEELTDHTEAELADVSWFDCLEMLRDLENAAYCD